MQGRDQESADAIWQRAEKVLPNGVSSGGRVAIRDVIVRAQGAYVWNAEDRRFVDYLLAWGPIVVGHCDARVNEAVLRAAATCDLNWVGPQAGEVELAEAICEVMPSAEKVAFCTSGTDAALHAVQLARTVTKRLRLLKFHGSYHGWQDHLAAGGKFALPERGQRLDEPQSAGLHPAVLADLTVVEWNDIDAVRNVFAGQGDELAAVVCEPYVHSYGCVPPESGFLEHLRELCSRHGALLVFDEIKSGFRAHLGGYQAVCGVTPDVTIFGKALGNGYSIAGLAGRKEYMEFIGAATDGKAEWNGTYNASPYAVAAGRATFEILLNGGIDRMHELADQLRQGLQEAVAKTGIEACVVGMGSEWAVYFRSDPPKTYREARDIDHKRAQAYWERMLEAGILEPPLSIGDRRLCLATSEDDIAETVEAATRALDGIR